MQARRGGVEGAYTNARDLSVPLSQAVKCGDVSSSRRIKRAYTNVCDLSVPLSKVDKIRSCKQDEEALRERTRTYVTETRQSIAPQIRILRDEIELYVAYRYGISLLTAHFDERLDNPSKTEYLLEIEHGIGVV